MHDPTPLDQAESEPVPAVSPVEVSPVTPEPILPEPAAATPRRRPFFLRRGVLLTVLLLIPLVLASLAGVALAGGWYGPTPLVAAPPLGEKAAKAEKSANKQLAGLGPRGTYVIVNTYANRLRVFKNEELVHEAVCSTGSGVVLKDPESGRVWEFDTPMGERHVQRKVKNPVWIKPDWAFIEEGMRPPKDGRERVDDISLGDYGLYLGDGYIIHGTVFQTLLGRRITHGCIRLGDKDLETVYQQVPVGARVYLY